MAPSRVPPSGSPKASTSKSSPSKRKRATAKVEKKPKKPAGAATKNKGKLEGAEADTVNEKKIVKVSTAGKDTIIH